MVVSGHSQGASHAAYLSTRVRVRAAVLFSGPQEGPNCSAWVRDAPQVLRRATFSAHEECGDAPALSSYCTAYPRLLRHNLEAMGLAPGLLGNGSGFVVLDFEPLVSEGRSHHDSVALQAKAPPPVVAAWRVLLARL